jgi:hypothetical protein
MGDGIANNEAAVDGLLRGAKTLDAELGGRLRENHPAKPGFSKRAARGGDHNRRDRTGIQALDPHLALARRAPARCGARPNLPSKAEHEFFSARGEICFRVHR